MVGILEQTEPESRGRSIALVILLHAFTSNPSHLHFIAQAVRENLPDADLLIPKYPATTFANTSTIRLTEAIVGAIDRAVDGRRANGGEYESIILIGHSLGALLARKAYVFARGENQDGSVEFKVRPRDWTDRVTRILLFAGMNRGWELNQKPEYMVWWRYLGFRLIVPISSALRVGRLILSVRRGAPFISNLRLQWMRLERSDPTHMPLTVQLLGTIDNLVSERDNIDLQSGSKFKYLVVQNSDHLGVVRLDDSPDGRERKRIFLKALLTEPDKLQSDHLPSLDADPEVQCVVFVMHGIRDTGHWTGQIVKRVQDMGHKMKIKAIGVSPGYGYFPMGRFLLRIRRQENIRWFMDKYTEIVAKYPAALNHISFIGHSNGTYLVASALGRYAATRFDRLAFAGSVVPRSYPWDHLISNKRVTAIRNDVASADYVVGIFPRFFELVGELIGRQTEEIGSAGFNGFTDDEGQKFAVTYVEGGHNAAVKPANYDSLVRFVLIGSIAPGAQTVESQSALCKIFSKLCWLVWAFLLTVVVSVGFFVIQWGVATGFGFWAPLLIYLAILYLILNTV